MKKKTKQDFQELLKTEHCKNPPLLRPVGVTHTFPWSVCSGRMYNTLSNMLPSVLQLYLKDLKSVNVSLSSRSTSTDRCVGLSRCTIETLTSSRKPSRSFPLFPNQVSMIESLRLLCLLSITENGESGSFERCVEDV